jgi:hypothetical protein
MIAIFLAIPFPAPFPVPNYIGIPALIIWLILAIASFIALFRKK